MLLSQASFAAVFWGRGNASPWKAAGAWWTIWGTLVDVGCLACLFFLTRRENLRIRDLLGPLPRWPVPKGMACFVLIYPFFSGWPSRQLAPLSLLASANASGSVGSTLASLRRSLEEFTCQGYLAWRLVALSRYRWVPY